MTEQSAGLTKRQDRRESRRDLTAFPPVLSLFVRLLNSLNSSVPVGWPASAYKCVVVVVVGAEADKDRMETAVATT